MTQPERVADYPRPPRLEASEEHVRVQAFGIVLADSRRALRVLETFHPPTYYLPPEDVRTDLLLPGPGRSFCEWKGVARYWDLLVGDQRLSGAIWSYPEPTAAFAALAGWLAFYPAAMEGCWVNDERVQPQPGRFYAGWITSRVQGPFKGDPLHPELI
ncbi:MAG: DUF427 domain-containing protein [Synechococcus sp. Tobar2m-G35]|jgi:uncharacterized protein (DUF427 family)|nr:DUF427 domain-containing protein [Synechococcus sp. Tobar2m-G35]